MESQVPQVVQELFPIYDRDRSGYLETRELGGFLTAALKRLGINATVTNEQAEQALRVIDRNKDNEVSQAEAAEALKSILAYKQQRNRQQGGTGGMGPTSNPGNNSWSPSPQIQPQQNQFSANNGWGAYQPSPPNPYGNSWAPSPAQQPYGQNSWQPQPPQYNNSWSQPTANNSSWNQQGPNYGGQYNSWSPANVTGGWQTPSDPQDQELRGLIDQLYLRYDRDRSGTLDKREMVQAMNELLI
jgi:hypothetical protein